MNHSYVVGERYRDARDPEEDEFQTWVRGPLDTGIGGTRGIRVLKGEDVPLDGEVACIVLVSSDLAREESLNRWDDEFDLERGRISYWGDAKRTAEGETVDLGDFPGNRRLLQAQRHVHDEEDRRRRYPPILVFRKPESGWVEFCGLAVVEHVEWDTFRDDGVSTPNYRFELGVLDAESVPVEWLHEWALTGSDELAPGAWHRWVDRGEVTPAIRYGGERPQQPSVGDWTPVEDTGTAGTEYTAERTEVRVSEAFHEGVYEAYGGECVLTDIDRRELLTVAHVLPRADRPDLAEALGNVFLVNWTHHAAFDAGLWTFDADGRLHVDPTFEPTDSWLRSTLHGWDGDVVPTLRDASVDPAALEAHNAALDWWPR